MPIYVESRPDGERVCRILIKRGIRMENVIRADWGWEVPDRLRTWMENVSRSDRGEEYPYKANGYEWRTYPESGEDECVCIVNAEDALGERIPADRRQKHR